jgi:hypothetical protein
MAGAVGFHSYLITVSFLILKSGDNTVEYLEFLHVIGFILQTGFFRRGRARFSSIGNLPGMAFAGILSIHLQANAESKE